MILSRYQLPRLFFISLFLLSIPTVHAEKEDMLSVTPQICVVEEGKKSCKTLLAIHYRNPQKSDYCVLIKAFDIKECFFQVEQFELTLDITSQADIHIEIEDQHLKTIVAQEQMSIVVFKAKTRKRRNLGWSFM